MTNKTTTSRRCHGWRCFKSSKLKLCDDTTRYRYFYSISETLLTNKSTEFYEKSKQINKYAWEQHEIKIKEMRKQQKRTPLSIRIKQKITDAQSIVLDKTFPNITNSTIQLNQAVGLVTTHKTFYKTRENKTINQHVNRKKKLELTSATVSKSCSAQTHTTFFSIIFLYFSLT